MKTVILCTILSIFAAILRLTSWPKRLETELDAMSREELRIVVDLLFAALSTFFWAMLLVLALTQIAHIIAGQGGL